MGEGGRRTNFGEGIGQDDPGRGFKVLKLGGNVDEHGGDDGGVEEGEEEAHADAVFRRAVSMGVSFEDYNVREGSSVV